MNNKTTPQFSGAAALSAVRLRRALRTPGAPAAPAGKYTLIHHPGALGPERPCTRTSLKFMMKTRLSRSMYLEADDYMTKLPRCRRRRVPDMIHQH